MTRTDRAFAWRTAILTSTALAVTAGVFAPAHAQEPIPPGGAVTASTAGTVDRIVVTAEFRERSAQDTPIAITAVTAATLEARSQTNIWEAGAQAPNVTLRPVGAAQGGSAMVAYIRGVGQTDFSYALEPGVGMYVDDVYFPTLTGSLVELMDVGRVEILRGPQGTLAGKNSIGGAIKIYTQPPTGGGDTVLSATYGAFNRAELRGSTDFEIVPDRLFARISGLGRTVDGYVTRYDYACLHPGSGVPTYVTGNGCELGTEGGQSLAALRGSLRFVATPGLEFTLSADTTHEDSEVRASILRRAVNTGAPFSVSPVPIYIDVDGDGVFDPGLDAPHDCRFVTKGPGSCDTNSPGAYSNYATYLDPETAVALSPAQDPWKPLVMEPVTTLEDWGVSLTADWRLNDAFSIKSITAARGYESRFTEDSDGSPLGVILMDQLLEHEQFSQELRLNGTVANGAVDFTLGGFYFDQDNALTARVNLPYTALDFINGPDTTPSTTTALFLNTTWHVTDRLNLTGGLRWSGEEKTYTFARHNPDGAVPAGPCVAFPGFPLNPANCGVFGLNGVTNIYEADRVDYRAAADYRWTDSLMTYAQFSTGYKGGGINPRPFAPDQAQPFGPESVEAWEIGAKVDVLDRRVRFNTAFFYNDYTDIQLTFSRCPASVAPVPCQQPQNAGDAEVKGWEAEVELHPARGLVIDGSVGLIDFDYTRLNPLTPVTMANVPPFTPDTTWSAGVQYTFDLGGMGSLTPRIDVAYQADMFQQPTNQPTSLIPSTTLAHARLTYDSPDGGWRAALEVKNLTGEYHVLTLYEQGAAGYTSAQPGWPRTWALTLTRTF